MHMHDFSNVVFLTYLDYEEIAITQRILNDKFLSYYKHICVFTPQEQSENLLVGLGGGVGDVKFVQQ